MIIDLNPSDVADYRLFIRAKALPRFRCRGRSIEVPDEYAAMLGRSPAADDQAGPAYRAFSRKLFDYQRDVSRLAIRKRKFAVFADCGLGKTLILLEFVRHVSRLIPRDRRILIISPLMVVRQTLRECLDWYGKSIAIEKIEASRLTTWLNGDSGEPDFRIGITNYDALTEATPQGKLGALILDESSMLKSHYGKWGTTCLRLGDGLPYKLCLTGTPAPNDRIEYANHAVFLDAFPTVNAFLARYFVNRGQTDNRWELKPHALAPFYRDLSDWCIFLTNPATYGWKDNCEAIPPIQIHVHDVDLTGEQRQAVYEETGTLFVQQAGGITQRSKLSRIGKGEHDGRKIATAKNEFIRRLVESWPDESTIIWCHYNAEQDAMESLFPGAASIRGETPIYKRDEMVDDFKAGRRRVLISKPKILGFGLNLQRATRQVFSGLQDSYEQFYQAVKRSNRYGSTRPLNVHIPVTEIERPMIETVLRKASRVQQDAEEQERIFKANGVQRWK